MNKDINKKILLMIFIFLILICAIIIYLVLQDKKVKEGYDYKADYDPNYTIGMKNRGNKQVEIEEEYYSVKSCIDKYYSIIDSYKYMSEELSEEEINTKKINLSNSLIDLLDEQYKNQFNITEKNIENKIISNYEKINFVVNEMYVFDCNDDISVYVVYGKELAEDINNNTGYLVKVDRKNNTYSIMPYEFLIKNNYEKLSEFNIKEIDTNYINENDNNYFTQSFLNYQDIVASVFKDYVLRAQYDTQSSYELLQSEYKEKKFKTYNSYEKYINSIKKMLNNDRIVKIKNDDDLYICQDKYENYILIKKPQEGLEYNLMLDLYTIPIEKITESYNKSNNAQKTALNIEKFKQMINLKDYNSAFNALDETFRKNNFGSVENFEKYIKQNWPEYINIKCSDYKEVSDVGTINVKITERGDSEEELYNVIEKTFIVKLVDANNFVMSFNIDE